MADTPERSVDQAVGALDPAPDAAPASSPFDARRARVERLYRTRGARCDVCTVRIASVDDADVVEAQVPPRATDPGAVGVALVLTHKSCTWDAIGTAARILDRGRF